MYMSLVIAKIAYNYTNLKMFLAKIYTNLKITAAPSLHAYLPRPSSAAFFNLINSLHEKVSLIITTNKAPTEWAETLDDEVLASALLDRLLYKCEVIKLSGASYRMENRQTILKKEVKRGRPRKNQISE